MYDGKKLNILLQNKRNARLCETLSASKNPTERFNFLISLRNEVDIEAYAMFVRILTQKDTHHVPLEILLKEYDGIKQDLLMSKEEIDKLALLPDKLIIYRGTDLFEYPPRISWSLIESNARMFENGQLYRAVVNKREILAYYSSNSDEEEIIAHVTDNFENVL